MIDRSQLTHLRCYATRGTLLLASLLIGTLALSACATSGTAPGSATAAPAIFKSAASEYPLYELRTYTSTEGNLDALHTRFRDHTLALFEKHGAKNIAYWTPTEQPNTLIYIIAHKSNDARTSLWESFLADPEWRAVYAASIANGKLVSNIDSVLLNATDYSPDLL